MSAFPPKADVVQSGLGKIEGPAFSPTELPLCLECTARLIPESSALHRVAVRLSWRRAESAYGS